MKKHKYAGREGQSGECWSVGRQDGLKGGELDTSQKITEKLSFIPWASAVRASKEITSGGKVEIAIGQVKEQGRREKNLRGVDSEEGRRGRPRLHDRNRCLEYKAIGCEG